MTRLRVLSGQHAGVSIDWLSTRLIVGASEELDVFIGDWNAQQIELQHDGQGGHQASWPACDDDVAVDGQQQQDGRMVCRLEPLVPVRFGAVILCIGPSDGPWPDDAQLLQRCFVPPPVPAAVQPARGRRRLPGRWRVVIVAVTSCTLAAASVTTQGTDDEAAVPQPVPAASRPAGAAPTARSLPSSAAAAAASATTAATTPADGAARLRRLVDAQALEGLAVENSTQTGVSRVVVRGVLRSRAAVDRLDRLLDALPADLPTSRRYAAAPEIVDRLYGALPDVGLAVRHLEQHRFEVAGRVDDPARVGAAVRNIALDLSELGVHVEAALQPRHDPVPTMSGLLVDSQGTSYLRTRDGVKHIVPGRASAMAALPAPGAPAPLEPLRAPAQGEAR